eukprot:gene5317-biopygen2781
MESKFSVRVQDSCKISRGHVVGDHGRPLREVCEEHVRGRSLQPRGGRPPAQRPHDMQRVRHLPRAHLLRGKLQPVTKCRQQRRRHQRGPDRRKAQLVQSD